MEKGKKVKLTKIGSLINAFSKIQVGDEMVFITENWTEIKALLELNYEEKYYKHYMLFKFKDNFILMGDNKSIKGFELLINEPQFKQGDKVLAKDKRKWDEVIFVVEYNNFYYCEYPKNKNELFKFQHIKPYEEEIKVGDWVKYDNQVFRVNGKELSSFLLECTKITNPQLIELLNNEL